jgi:ADP-heptose:LPS heptosyltransferase/glycosyltransferase involved in cell wall biosynthesis
VTSVVAASSRARVVLLALDTLGDLVLREPLFSGLLEHGCQVTVVVRPPYDTILPYLDRRLDAVVVDVVPHALPDARALAALDAAAIEIAGRAADIIVATAHNRSHTDEWLLHQFPACETIGFVNPDKPSSLLDALPLHVRRPRTRRASLFTHVVDCAADAHETDKTRALFRAVTGVDLPDRAPRITLDEGARAAARATLDELGLTPGEYVVGCPTGTQTVALKAWPSSQYVDLAVHLRDRHQLPVLLTGSRDEAPILHDIARAAAARGQRLPIWTGAPTDLGTLIGLIAHSRLYLGNDTGPMHLAGALGVPVVARFGGGHWPRFLPVGHRSFAATQQLPCFRCAWHCYREEPACMTRIETRTFIDGLDWVLAGDASEHRVDCGKPATQPWPAALEVRTPPKVLVVTPSFNQGQFLRETIESVLNQSYEHVEYVVADGGSTDESVAILRSYGDRVRWKSGPDEGQAAVINEAWRQSDADIVAWLNSDDTYLPDAIATAVDHLVTHRDTAMVYGQAWSIDADNHRLEPYRTKPFDRDVLAGECFICQPAAFVRRSALDVVEPPDPSLRYGMDYDLWIRLSECFRVDYVERFLANSRVHPATKTLSQTDAMLREIVGVVQRHYGVVHRNWRFEHARHAWLRTIGRVPLIPLRIQEQMLALTEEYLHGDQVGLPYEDWWVGRRTAVTVDSGERGRVHLDCECTPHLSPLRVTVSLGEELLAVHEASQPGRFDLTFELPAHAQPRARVVLSTDRSFIPVVRGLNSDPRALSFRLFGQHSTPRA